ncbi:MAG: RadC family protein [Salinivirgaceae bacterium]|jgi:DNA repair protein RadC|nr:DNA repair protein RadC [Bacteroidales bacterium]
MSNSKKLSINQWALEDRPREKLLLKGSRELSNAELLAILLGSGSITESAVDLSKRIMKAYNDDLSEFFGASIADLQKFKGVGEAKSVTIMAAIELARRYVASKGEKTPTFVHSPEDAYRAILPTLIGVKHEEFWILCLSASNQIISKYKISQGGLTSTTVDLRVIFQRVLADNAVSIIVCHNHPSGSTVISEPDKKITQRIKSAAQTLDIVLHDHIIVTDSTFVSFSEKNLL